MLRLFFLAVLQVVSLAIFCKGFFPYKIYLSGFATAQDTSPWLDNSSTHNSPWMEPEFDRLVFIVVDALRNDFVLGNESGFSFVKSLIDSGTAIPFTARATAPTVTMPRIKALTTGTVPSFLDAILNIAESDTTSSLVHHDNWVYQFKHSGDRRIHLFGDDTWLRLFPGLFSKTDGTTSFYVSDTIEVDTNVTRHIDTDIVKTDWDAIVLHYLGLDHVGHLGGPKSPLMLPKQKEMDHAVERIYDIIANQDADRLANDMNAKGTLIVLCGDHGMNDDGNHGGSSVGETSSALVFMSPRFESRPTLKRNTRQTRDRDTVLGHPVIDQVDVVPTLASLFGFPIPKNNLGKLIVDLYRGDKLEAIHRALQLNAHQLARLLSKVFPDLLLYLDDPQQPLSKDASTAVTLYTQAFQLHHQLSQGLNKIPHDRVTDAYLDFIEYAQSHLVNTASDYSLPHMGVGVVGMTLSAILFVWQATSQSRKENKGADIASGNWPLSRRFAILAFGAYAVSMFASSFVEEEHFTWYYFSQTMFLLLALQSFEVPNKTFGGQIRLSSLCLVQLLFFRLSTGFSGYFAPFVHAADGLQWHLLAVSLCVPLVYAVYELFIKRIGSSDVHQSVSIIRFMWNMVYLLTASLTTVLVMAYKLRAEGGTLQSSIYDHVLQIEFLQGLSQVELGQLIFNYGGAMFCVLSILMYVNNRASFSTVTVHQDQYHESYLQLLLHLITPLLILLSKPQYASLFVLFDIQLQLLLGWQRSLPSNAALPPWILATVVLFLGQSGFFITGHSNSIASVDLSNAYIGVQAYDVFFIGVMTFCSNWAASLWWVFAGWVLLTDRGWTAERWHSYLWAQSAIFSVFIAVLSISITILREHLFIWTVFSPKYLYQIAWSVLFHWVAQVLCGSCIVRVWLGWLQPAIVIEEHVVTEEVEEIDLDPAELTESDTEVIDSIQSEAEIGESL
ncbi:alkaline-phosphatase-like protein [Radiomyces spectabilis]|uniref:alkaline-phosphatase-like protein n=1 Tax=Radiomyces spectabilis TaxID=64574 RepID=UPI00221FFC8F|nr:alkaline-phosphatase-like protein [Radiomyces spectabilis]KAI8371582.1 alkaline-phosphatase-like protein [Radiomyces spectabilis]